MNTNTENNRKFVVQVEPGFSGVLLPPDVLGGVAEYQAERHPSVRVYASASEWLVRPGAATPVDPGFELVATFRQGVL